MKKYEQQIIRDIRQLAARECANWRDGFCLSEDGLCHVINPAYDSIHDGCIDCDWFTEAV